jgi:hypothetical protein
MRFHLTDLMTVILSSWKTEVRFTGHEVCFNFSITSRMALGSIQPPFKWISRALSPAINRQLHLVSTFRMRETLPYPPPNPQYAYMAWCLATRIYTVVTRQDAKVR